MLGLKGSLIKNVRRSETGPNCFYQKKVGKFFWYVAFRVCWNFYFVPFYYFKFAIEIFFAIFKVFFPGIQIRSAKLNLISR